MVAVSSPFALFLTLAVTVSAAPVGTPRTTPAAVWNVVSTSATKALLNTPRVKPSTSDAPVPSSTSKEYLNTPRVKPSTISVVLSTTTSTTTAPTAVVTAKTGCPVDTPFLDYKTNECYCSRPEHPAALQWATCGLDKHGVAGGLTCATPGLTKDLTLGICTFCEDGGVYTSGLFHRYFEPRDECKGVPNRPKPSTAAPTSTKPGYSPPKATTSWSWVTAVPTAP